MTPKLQLMLGLELEMIWAMIYSFKHDHSELAFGVDWPLLMTEGYFWFVPCRSSHILEFVVEFSQ